MVKFKGRTSSINRDSGAPKVRATRQKLLKGLRAKEATPIGDPFKQIPKMAKLPKTLEPKGKKGK